MLLSAITVLCLLSTAPIAWTQTDRGVQSGQSQSVYGKDFWQAVAKNDYKPPAGKSTAELSRPLSAMLGSPDPEMRDEIAYKTFFHWIYQERTRGEC
jgi:hypothetical protein